MSPARCFRAALATLVVATACSEEPTTAVPIGDPEVSPDLALSFPEVTGQALMRTEVEEIAPPEGAARVLMDDELPEGPLPEDVTQIINPITRVGFQNDYAFSQGRHSYTGNIGGVTTTATVTFDGQVIGSASASKQQHTAFLLDLGQVTAIWTEAYVFIKQDCGLTVDGASKHTAQWQWFLGNYVANWGDAWLTTQAFPPVSQPACEPPPPEQLEPGYIAHEIDPGDAWEGSTLTCYYLVGYNPYTGEIYYVDFLYCDDVDFDINA